MLKISFVTNLLQKNGLPTEKFINKLLRDLSLEFIALGLSFGKVGPGIFCMTMHQCILRVLSLRFWLKVEFPYYPIHPTLIYCRLTCLFPELKIVTKGTRFEAVSSIQQSVMRKLKAIREEAFSREFNLLYERCKRYAEVDRDYIE
jgi:hypothetical protein